MRRKIIIAVAAVMVPAVTFAYAISRNYLPDDFDGYLQEMGYNPLHPPRSKFTLGSLYDIDNTGNLDLVCPTTETMVQNVVGPDLININRVKTGSFSVIGDIADRINATAGSDYSKRVRLSLRDIQLMQIPASQDGKIQAALVRDEDCVRAVTNRLRLRHYICQVESSFSAVAVYEIKDGVNTSATTGGGSSKGAPSSDNVKRVLTEAVQANTQMQTKNSGDSVMTGNLVFGVKLEPVCISPLHAIFVRTWPQSAFDRSIDYVKYQVIEPLFVKDLFGEQTQTLAAQW